MKVYLITLNGTTERLGRPYGFYRDMLRGAYRSSSERWYAILNDLADTPIKDTQDLESRILARTHEDEAHSDVVVRFIKHCCDMFVPGSIVSFEVTVPDD